MSDIAIVGMACRYADAKTPQELWENVLSQRKAFRRIPSERLSLADYYSSDRTSPDRIYSQEAAVIEGYEFDRVAFRVVGSTYRSADLAHWLALDIATQALVDAGFTDDLPRETTGVLLGNTLTGEGARANTLRLRWPYVRRVLEAYSQEKGQILPLDELERRFKEPFPEIGEESLAGNLSNTIAGRICNHFDLKGGGYIIDGACSSSLLAIAQSCSALLAKDLDVALAGGIDISLDPFELVGFAKTNALAEGEMRVYDVRSAGFIPGEGCGIVVLMRYEDALIQQKRIYGLIRGWGISSDGQGGITRPEARGQQLAMQRAYHRAGFGVETVGYFEGHGTGTAVGDATELQAIDRSLVETRHVASLQPAAIGSIKANIGHTKAAAGVAGLIKATMALHQQVLPPTTGCEIPHPQLTDGLRILKTGELWPPSVPLRAGVSAMGFGGINTHLVLEGLAAVRRQSLTPKEQQLVSSSQDAELILLAATDNAQLEEKVKHLLTFSAQLSRSEIGDLAATLAKDLDVSLPVRAAIISNHPQDLTEKLNTLKTKLEQLSSDRAHAMRYLSSHLFLGVGTQKPNIAFLFPGQAAPVYLDGGLWARRFPRLKALYEGADLPKGEDLKSTAIAQPAIITSSVAGLQILAQLGIEAEISVGHSLGELAALHWAGVYDAATVIDLAKIRGQVMAKLGQPTGTMASIGANAEDVQALLNGKIVVIAGLNSPSQTVISGESEGVHQVIEKAQNKGWPAVLLPVSHAFHSPLVAASVAPLAEYLSRQNFQPLQKTVVSTVTGTILDSQTNLQSLLLEQITSPVRFIEAISTATKDCDLSIEVGAGHILNRLVTDFINIPIVSLDAGSSSIEGLLQAVGAAFALGVPMRHSILWENRFIRPFNLDWQPHFIPNPCELAPLSEPETPGILKIVPKKPEIISNESPLNCIRQLVAQRTELPLDAIKEDHRLLSDLHLNSITVSQLVIEAAKSLGLSPLVSPTDYADASILEIAQALHQLSSLGGTTPPETVPSGVDGWIKTFSVELVETPLSTPTKKLSHLQQWSLLIPDDYPLKTSLEKAFEQALGEGVIVCLPTNPDISHLDLLLEGAKQAIAEASSFVLIQHNGGGAAFARTFYLENPQIATCIIDVPLEHPEAVAWILQEVQANTGFSEAYYNPQGIRRSPVLQLLPLSPTESHPNLTAQDVLLVTGGGKGIAAECALSLAQETGVQLAILGRSHPETDAELSQNLTRLQASGVNVLYLSADVTDTAEVTQAVGQIESQLGTITAILHGAGINTPKLIKTLDKKDILYTITPKLQGLQNLIAAVQPHALKQLITFGSIIARMGLAGEADYALANEWLGFAVAQFQRQYPNCRCLNLEWSVWSGAGMGERLGRVDSLLRQGITPIPIDKGVFLLRHLMGQTLPMTSVVISGRFGHPETLKLPRTDLPFLRFIEDARVYYPEIELVVDAELSPETDLYLDDHIYEGERILPGVMGLEAMAQVAMALLETDKIPLFEQVQFYRPVVIPRDTPIKIRIAAIVRDCGRVDVVLRSEQTSFAVDHFQVTCTPNKRKKKKTSDIAIQSQYSPLIQPEKDLYREILFHTGRFCRLEKYHDLRSTECLAEISPTQQPWFSRYLPDELVLGDPGVRDAVIHALQACVSQSTILPTGIERLKIYQKTSSERYFVWAKERRHIQNTFIYDLEVMDMKGVIVEEWQGLQLEVIKNKDPHSSWVAPLLAPYLERCLTKMTRSDLRIIIEYDPMVERRARSDRILRSFGIPLHRLDGKPELTNGKSVSVAHTEDLTLVVVGSSRLACDVEPVVNRSADLWCDLLGVSHFALANAIAQEKRENLDTAATRLWTVLECLKKAEEIINTPLLLHDSTSEQWVWFKVGDILIGTFVATVREMDKPLVIALAIPPKNPCKSFTKSIN